VLVERLIESLRRHPRRVAVADPTRALTYRQLTRLASVLRDELRRATSCPRVGIMLPASTVFPATLYGTLWAGKTAVPLNFLLNPEELARVVQSADIDVIVTVRHFAETVEALDARAAYIEDLPLKRRMLWASLRALPSVPAAAPDETAVVLFTSGTTAEPKGVELTQRNLASNCDDSIHSLQIDDAESFLNVLPPFHVFGLTGTVLIPATLGATVFAVPRFSPVAFARAIAKQRLSVILAVPSMYAAVLKTKSADRASFESVNLAVSGGEPLPDSVRDRFRERFGVTLRQGYGLTETSPVISCCTVRHHRDGSVGRPIRNVALRIVDEDGRKLGVGDDGELLVRGPGVMKGYFRRPDDTSRVLDGQGWFRTGDVCRVDEDGYLWITGRAKDMMIIGGENVFPREIESVLEAHEGVVQASVIGVPDGLRGEVPVAYVIPKEGASVTDHELRSFARRSLAGFKVPKRVVIRDDLPTGPTGKILKRRLGDSL